MKDNHRNPNIVDISCALFTLVTSIIFWSKIHTFFNLCFKRSAVFLRSFSYQNYGRRWTLRRRKSWKTHEKHMKNSWKNTINYNSVLTSSMTSHSWVIYHLKALHLKLWYSDFFDDPTTWWRQRAIWKIFWKWRFRATKWMNHPKFFLNRLL